jgi:carbon monoxide dehydrogenase subunit G
VKLDGRIEIAAPPAAVWEVVIDPLSLAACVPGVQEATRVDDRTFTGRITASVGPIDGPFTFESVITRAEQPDLEVEMQGQDSVTKSRLTTSMQVSVEPSGAGTVLVYHAQVNVKGRLAILGEMVLRATAAVMVGNVTKCLKRRLEAEAPAAAS